jgi:hypothetical protein
VEDARKRIKEVIDELWPLLMPNNEEAMRPELVVRIIEDGNPSDHQTIRPFEFAPIEAMRPFDHEPLNLETMNGS